MNAMSRCWRISSVTSSKGSGCAPGLRIGSSPFGMTGPCAFAGTVIVAARTRLTTRTSAPACMARSNRRCIASLPCVRAPPAGGVFDRKVSRVGERCQGDTGHFVRARSNRPAESVSGQAAGARRDLEKQRAPRERGALLYAYAKRARRFGRYLPVLTYWMQSPWFLNDVPLARVRSAQPPFLHSSFFVATPAASPWPSCTLVMVHIPGWSAMTNGRLLLTFHVGFAAAKAAQLTHDPPPPYATVHVESLRESVPVLALPSLQRSEEHTSELQSLTNLV